MKRIVSVFLVILLSFVFTATLYADAKIDNSTSASGYISISYSGDFSAPIKALVSKDGQKYAYDIPNSNPITVPLQMGTGSYTVAVLQSVGGNRYAPLTSQNFTVSSINESTMYKISSPLINYNASRTAMAYYKKLASSLAGKAKIDAVYNDVIKNYSYDYDEAASVKSGYVPVIDSVYAKKKGICYDYAVMMAGMLRAQGIPVKLVMGYAKGIAEYHAWNEIMVNGSWVIVDTTYDSAMVKGKAAYSFAKSSANYKTVMVY